MPTPVNVKHQKCDVYCGRIRGRVPPVVGQRGWLGNPIKRGERCPECGQVHTEPGSTLECYEQYLRHRLRAPHWRNAFIRAIDPDSRLGCYCKPGPCHTDVIARVYNEIMEEQL